MFGEALTGLSAIKTAFELAKSLKDMNDATVRNTAVIELQQHIITAQQVQSALAKQVEDLQKEISRFRRWEIEKKRYRLRDFGGNSFAYELRQDEAGAEPIHRICPNCYEKAVKSILQYRGGDAFGREHFHCNDCKSDFVFGTKQPRRTTTEARRRYSPFDRL